MDINGMLDELQSAERKTEASFLSLSDLFPQLLAVRKNARSENLLERLSPLQRECSLFGSLSARFWTGREVTYDPMLEKLNEKVAMLSDLENDVRIIRECSEEMELLALNAMVISIKSGARGKAFSSITESLKKLSSSMISNSARLVREQNFLLENINSLGETISELSALQKSAVLSCSNATSAMQNILQSISRPLPEMEGRAKDVWGYIVKSMETVQIQDIIKQSAAQVVLCLKEFKDYSSIPESDASRRNDIIDFDIQICKIALEILKDVSSSLSECISIFKDDWDSLSAILENVEKTRKEFIDSFYSNSEGQESLASQFKRSLEQFRQVLDEFFDYLALQKALVKTCAVIKARSRSISIVFMDLLPVVNSLQHVRVLQKIEIEKNTAISSVRNSASDMDVFINRSRETIDEMSRLLTTFSAESAKLISSFIAEITQTGELASEIKASGGDFFSRLRAAQNELGKTLKTYTVFPAGFDKKCSSVRAHLEALASVSASYMHLSDELSREVERLSAMQRAELEKSGVSSWKLEDNSFKEIIDRFTIRLHKNIAGSITGVEVEDGAELGSVTFF